MFKTEMHCHSAPVSFCARAKAGYIVERYLEAGYTSLVSTNHIDMDTFRDMEDASWQDKVAYYVDGYRELTEAAKGRLHILLGAEITLAGNDYLIYGLTEDFLRRVEYPHKLSGAAELSSVVRESGMMIFQAHPFRIGMTIQYPELFDGIEIINFSSVPSYNELSQMWAKIHNLTGITGSDFHTSENTPRGGIMTDYPITDNETLLKTLRENTFTPILE